LGIDSGESQMIDANLVVIVVFGLVLSVILVAAAVKYLVPMFKPILQSREPAAMAKFLVTGIKLQNLELVQKGLQERRIYSYLEDEILRARDMYLDHVSSKGLMSEELSEAHFEQALVEILADGDRSALGLEESLEGKPLR
jgi:hypothetical protein